MLFGLAGIIESTRPAFVEMMTALHSDGVKLVLVESLGRFARDPMIQESILHDLCGDDHGAFQEYEKTMITLKLRGARQRMRTKIGRCEGRKPYGHCGGESDALEHMRALRAAGLGYDRVADALNAEGPKPRTGGRWWGKTMNNILS
jgi:hypothetical protein